MYNEGRGVPQNYTEAMKYYQQAAEQGDAGAQYNIGVMYFNGEGEPQNYVKAYASISVAAALQDPSARENLSIVQAKMTPEQVAEGQRQAELPLSLQL